MCAARVSAAVTQCLSGYHLTFKSEALDPVIDDTAASQPREFVDNDAATNTPNGVDTNMPTSSKGASRKRKAKGTSETPGTSTTSTKKAKASHAPVDSLQDDESLLPPRLNRGGACNHCCEKKIKYDGAKPTGNQCKRGL